MSDAAKPPWTDPLSAWVIARVERRTTGLREQRAAFGIIEGWVGMCLNTVLFAVKLALGMSIGSVALIADAVHTLADGVSSAVLIIGSYVARRPADREHPYGHGRAEIVAAIIIAVLLGIAGVEFFKSSVQRILAPLPLVADWVVVVVVLGLAVVKELNARFAVSLARRCGSKAIEADAWHHRSDVFATILVAVGIIGAKYGWLILDGIMGIAVSLVILLTAMHLAKQSVDPLIGAAPEPEEIERLAAAALTVAGVHGVHDIVMHDYGDVRLISLHIETCASESPLAMHATAEAVQQLLGEGRKGHVVVHVDPVDRSHPGYADAYRAVEQIVAAEPRVQSFHDLRLAGQGAELELTCDLVLEPEVADIGAVKREIILQIKKATEVASVEVAVEPLFAYGARSNKDASS